MRNLFSTAFESLSFKLIYLDSAFAKKAKFLIITNEFKKITALIFNF